MKPIIACLGLVATVCCAVLLASPVGAIEGANPAWPGVEGQAGPWANGIYVIGDSISGNYRTTVPYGETNAGFGMHTWWRIGPGWSSRAHNVVEWGYGNWTSVQAAVRSPASTVFVQLGTNDTNCMRPGYLCGDAPKDDYEREVERFAMFLEAYSIGKQLTDAGKCVVWAGPREIERPTSSIEEPRYFNDILRALEDYFPGKFFHADYSAYTFSNAALRQDLDGGDGIHPRTADGRQAIANFAIYLSRLYCGASADL